MTLPWEGTPLTSARVFTFLFTDIQGSTRLWEEHPEAMRPSLARHDVILRSAIEGHGGHVFKTIGDAFTALQNGQVEGVIYDLAVAQDAVEKSEGELRIVETVPTGQQYGIAFPKDSDLVEPVNQALAEIKADGTYEEIYERWIGVPPEEIP